MSDVNYYLGMHPLGALSIVVSTILLYVAFVGFLRFTGQRLFASPSSLDLAVVTVLGAIVGRAILGQVPTLAGGLLALGTLAVLELLMGRLRRTWNAREGRQHRAVVVMLAGRPEREMMRRYGIDDVSLWGALRGSGVRDPKEVALVVLEQTGTFSIFRTGVPIHPAALTGVRRADSLMVRLHEAGLAGRHNHP